MRAHLITICVLMSASLCGCAVREVQTDQDKIRCALLDLYTNQMMDNLIRAYNKMPIIQVDYANATSTVTVKETSSIGDMVVTTHTNVFTAAATAMLAVTSTTLNTLSGSLGFDNQNQVSVIASPVTTSDTVYDAYDTFLAIDGSFRATPEPPASNEAHLCKQCGGVYYWIPVGYEKECLRLSLATMVQRASTAVPVDPFYSVNIIQVLKQELIPNQGGDTTTPNNYWLTIKIDKKIPIDDGVVDISSSSASNKAPSPAQSAGTKPAVVTQPGTSNATAPPTTQAVGAQVTGGLAIFYDNAQEMQAGRSHTTDILRVEFFTASPPPGFKTAGALSAAINSQSMPAKVYLYRHRPQTSTPSDVNSRIEFYLQQIQQGQFRGAGP
jgi:hypothetical protein